MKVQTGTLGDRRVLKTRASLHGALFSLMQEKSYEAIVVKEILDRANIGRSTFYAHYAGKDELLTAGMSDMLSTLRPSGREAAQRPVIWFALPIFEHIDAHRRAGAPRVSAQGRAAMHQQLQMLLTELIEGALSGRTRRKDAPPVPLDILVGFVSSTFVFVIDQWLGSDPSGAAEEAHGIFQSLVQPVLASVFAS